MKLVIAGAGIMGISTAYYARKLMEDREDEDKEELEIVIVDALGLAKCASGNAGGLLAKNWSKGHWTEISSKGFDLYDELASELGADVIEYKRVIARNCHVAREKTKTKKKGHRDEFNNVFDNRKVLPGKVVSSDEVVAQVTPHLLLKEMFTYSKATLIIGDIVGIRHKHDDNQTITNLIIKKSDKNNGIFIEDIAGDEFCFCLGMWSHTLRYFNLKVPRSFGRKLHFVLLKARQDLKDKLDTLNTFIMTDLNNTEIIIRPRGRIYLNGSDTKSSYERIMFKPGDITVDNRACKKLVGFWNYLTSKRVIPNHSKLFREMDYTTTDDNDKSKKNETIPVIKAETCYLPAIDHKYDNQQVPAMSKIPKTNNAYICAGHKASGILCGPISGKIMAHMILENNHSCVVDTSPFRLDLKVMREASRKSQRSLKSQKSQKGKRTSRKYSLT